MGAKFAYTTYTCMSTCRDCFQVHLPTLHVSVGMQVLRGCISTDICTQHRPNLEDEKSPTKIEINAFHLCTTASNLEKKWIWGR